MWQKNAVFTTDIIQPIFDLAANPAYGEHSQTNTLLSMDNSPKLSNTIIVTMYIKYYFIVYYNQYLFWVN